MGITTISVPESIEMKDLEQSLQGVNGANNIHHLHVWALSTTEFDLYYDRPLSKGDHWLSFRAHFGDFRQKYGIRSVLYGVFARHLTAEDHQSFVDRLVKLWYDKYQPSEVMNNHREIVAIHIPECSIITNLGVCY